jgi:hypothetical protein
VVVRLALPHDARLHDIFHTGVLKKFVVAPPELPPELPPSLTARWCLSRPRCCTRAWPVVFDRCWSSGVASWKTSRRGRTLMIFVTGTRCSSSRTSWSSRMGEMSCTAGPRSGNGVPVTCGVRWSALIAPRRFQPPTLVAEDGNKLELIGRFVCMVRIKEQLAPCV